MLQSLLTMETNSATAVEEGLPNSVFGAAVNDDTQAVTAWLDGGGGVDARQRAEQDQTTLLMVATARGQEAMVRMLL